MKTENEIREISAQSTAEKKWYREKIMEMVEQIEDVWVLEQIHKFIINMTKEGN